MPIVPPRVARAVEQREMGSAIASLNPSSIATAAETPTQTCPSARRKAGGRRGCTTQDFPEQAAENKQAEQQETAVARANKVLEDAGAAVTEDRG